MEIIKISSKTADVRLSNSELNTLINALIEVCNALYVSEFKTRMGVSREETLALSESIIRLLETKNHNSINSKERKTTMQLIKTVGEQAEVQFSTNELFTFNNALNEVCNGVKLVDFETKIGVSREEARILLNSVYKLLNELRSPS